MFKPQYKLSNNIVCMLTTIAEAKAVIERAKLLPKQELQLRRQALIRMTHSSTQIEGNILDIHQVEALLTHKRIDAPARDIYEVKNYLKAMRYINKVVGGKQKITQRVILRVHKLVTDMTLPKEQSGQYRNIPIYVVRQRLGLPQEILYTGPDAKRVPVLMANLVKWLQESQKQNIHPVVVAGVVHQEIAAIHPFVDGNGRTARAVATLVLYQQGYDFRRLFALEDYYNKDRPKYYQAINCGKSYEKRVKDFTPWLEYFIEGFKQEIDDVKMKIITLSKKKLTQKAESQIYLAPEQLKIIEFLDQVREIAVKDVVDILKCPKRTAQSYLQKLKKLKIITQIGKGPTTTYILAE